MTAVRTEDGRWWQLPALLAATNEASVDLAVVLGKEDQVAARLVAVRAPQEVVDQRRRRLREEARQKGQTVSALRMALAAWSVYVTTVPPELLSVEEALIVGRARWQIEMLFKLWKSHGQIDLVRNVQKWRVVCELYARLLGQVVQHWLLLVSCWEHIDRSLMKAAHTLRLYWMSVAGALRFPGRLEVVLTEVARCIGMGCRMDPRKKSPNTYQRFQQAGDTYPM